MIADPSSHTQGNASEDMVVTLFRKTEAPLHLLSAGMPILFRALKVRIQVSRRGMPRAVLCRVVPRPSAE